MNEYGVLWFHSPCLYLLGLCEVLLSCSCLTWIISNERVSLDGGWNGQDGCVEVGYENGCMMWGEKWYGLALGVGEERWWRQLGIWKIGCYLFKIRTIWLGWLLSGAKFCEGQGKWLRVNLLLKVANVTWLVAKFGWFDGSCWRWSMLSLLSNSSLWIFIFQSVKSDPRCSTIHFK